MDGSVDKYVKQWKGGGGNGDTGRGGSIRVVNAERDAKNVVEGLEEAI